MNRDPSASERQALPAERDIVLYNCLGVLLSEKTTHPVDLQLIGEGGAPARIEQLSITQPEIPSDSKLGKLGVNVVHVWRLPKRVDMGQSHPQELPERININVTSDADPLKLFTITADQEEIEVKTLDEETGVERDATRNELYDLTTVLRAVQSDGIS